MFAAVDVSGLMSFLNSVLPSLNLIDPMVAGLGAVILFVLQSIGGKKFDFWGTVRWALSKFAPAPAVAVPTDLAPHEADMMTRVLDAIKAARDASSKAVAGVQTEGVLSSVLNAITADKK